MDSPKLLSVSSKLEDIGINKLYGRNRDSSSSRGQSNHYQTTNNSSVDLKEGHTTSNSVSEAAAKLLSTSTHILNLKNGKPARSREGSVNRLSNYSKCSSDQSDNSSDYSNAKNFANSRICSQDFKGSAYERFQLVGSNRTYRYMEAPVRSRIVDYPEITVPSPAQENSLYERLPPQVTYGCVDDQKVYPLFEFNSILQFFPDMEYYRRCRPNMNEVDKAIVNKFDLLQQMVRDHSRRIKKRYADKLQEEENKRVLEEQSFKEQPAVTNNGKSRRLSRSKTESKILEGEHPKKRLGFFSRKRSDVDHLRRHMGQLHTDSE